MKRFFVSLLMLLGVIIMIVGCAQKQVAQGPEQPGSQAGDKQKAGDGARDLSKEAISERELAKAEQAGAKYSFKELQTKIQDIHFDFDKYDIRNDAKQILKDVAAALAKEPKAKLVVEGHCDERGTTEYNLALGDRRANSTKSYLGSLGIPSKRIDTVSYGKEKPLCTEATEDCWQKNRRAHFVLIEENR